MTMFHDVFFFFCFVLLWASTFAYICIGIGDIYDSTFSVGVMGLVLFISMHCIAPIMICISCYHIVNIRKTNQLNTERNFSYFV